MKSYTKRRYVSCYLTQALSQKSLSSSPAPAVREHRTGMPNFRQRLATLFRLYLTLWLPFQAFWVEGAVLPANSAFRNGSSLFLPTSPNMVDFHCSHERSWSDQQWFEVKECGVALLYMTFKEMSNPSHGTTPREFVAPRARSSGRFGEPIMTPRKYVVRESTQWQRLFPSGLLSLMLAVCFRIVFLY